MKAQDRIRAQYLPHLREAAEIAEAAHEGQFYGPFPYMYHVYGVASRFATDDPVAQIVALLHDTFEDSPLDWDTLRDYTSLPRVAIDAVAFLTHTKGVPYHEYIADLRDATGYAGTLARKVKIEDIKFNLAHQPKPEKVPKYHNALEVLRDAENRRVFGDKYRSA